MGFHFDGETFLFLTLEKPYHVDLADDHDVMLNQGSIENSVAIYTCHILMGFETFLERRHVILFNNFTIEHLG